MDGFELSMLGNLNCEELQLESLSIPASAPLTTQVINVSGCILVDIIGNLCGLLDNITCDTLYLDTLDVDATCDSLLKMLPSRVRKLDLAMPIQRIQDELYI